MNAITSFSARMVPVIPNLVTSVGALSIVRGVRCYYLPSDQYKEFGLPLEQAAGGTATEPTISPLIYVKGTRDLSWGIALLALEMNRQEAAVTILIAVGALMSLLDGIVVWKHTPSHQRKGTAYVHWVTFVLSVGWYLGRLPLSQGCR